MYDERKKCLLLLRLCNKYLCLKHETMPEEMRVKIWNNIKRHMNNSKPLTSMKDGDSELAQIK